MSTLILTKDDISKIINMKEVLLTVKAVLIKKAEGKTIIPNRILLNSKISSNYYLDGSFNGMAGYVGPDKEEGIVGLKWISRFDNNRTLGIPTLNAVTMINDTNTGMPLAIADGSLITAFRTGAVTTLGAKYLARDNSEIISLIGVGVQARIHLMAARARQ